MINLIIHPGFSKTGTQFLQEKIFRRINCNLLGKVLCDTLGTRQHDTIFFKLFKSSYYPENNPFKKQKRLSLYHLKEEYKNYLINNFSKKGKMFILSDGGMLGDVDLKGLANLYLFKEIIDEIVNEKQIQIKIKFIISIRNQFDLIRALYNSFDERFDSKSLESLMKKVCDSNDKSFYYFFDLTNLVKSIKKIFNCEVLLLPLEKLMTDPEDYKKDIENFLNIKIEIPNEDLGTKVNIGYINNNGNKQYFKMRRDTRYLYLYFVLSKLHVSLKKYDFYLRNYRKNKFLKFIHKIFKPQVKTKIQKPLSNEPELKKKIFGIYSNTNQELERITGTNLKKYNYY